jgi:hypothetical protein
MCVEGCGVPVAKYPRIRGGALVVHYNPMYTHKLENSEVANNDIHLCGDLWGFYRHQKKKLGKL